MTWTPSSTAGHRIVEGYNVGLTRERRKLGGNGLLSVAALALSCPLACETAVAWVLATEVSGAFPVHDYHGGKRCDIPKAKLEVERVLVKERLEIEEADRRHDDAVRIILDLDRENLEREIVMGA